MYSADPDYAIGGEVITDTAAHTGRFKCVDFYEDTQIAAMTSNLTGNTIAAETVKHGTRIYGVITSITLTSGACIAYRI
jgi:hypothetical protein